MEYATSLGFPTWSHKVHPCPLCWGFGGAMFNLRNYSALSLPWLLKTWQHYLDSCAACEIVIDPLLPQVWRKIRSSLAYDRRDGKTASRGRALEIDIPECNLLRGDRLEPSDSVRDVGATFDQHCPPRVVFWRPSAETLTHHRSPFFCAETGMTPS